MSDGSKLLQNGSDEDLDSAHLMRMAGRFARRDSRYGMQQRTTETSDRRALFAGTSSRLWMLSGLGGPSEGHGVGRSRSKQGVICNLEAKRPFINHYSFHIIDPEWGHITTKMAGHPSFGPQIILNDHEYVGCRAWQQKIRFTKEGNCFTLISKPAELAKVADTLPAAYRALTPALRALDHLHLLPIRLNTAVT